MKNFVFAFQFLHKLQNIVQNSINDRKNMTKYVLLVLVLISRISFGQIKTFNGKQLNDAEFQGKIKKAMDSLQVQGMSIAIINNGKIVFNKGFGVANTLSKKKVTPSTFFEAASLSKPVFALFVLQLAKEGRLDLNRPLFEYLPADNIEDERYKKITAKMVLSHTTGLPNWSETGKMQLQSEPGKQFSYSGEAYVYLGRVIAKLSNTSFKNLDAVFQNKVAKELKLNDFHFVITPEVEKNLADGYQKKHFVKDERDRSSFDPAGGLLANTRNYSEFLIHLMNKKLNFSEMFEPVVALDQDSLIREYFGVDSWTLGMAVIKLNGKLNYWHGGNNLGYTSSFMIDPDKKFGYVYFTNEDQCNGMKKVVENILWK
ncbi:serine hydrolase domain-containing protein [Chryseobacterium arthrosphaerae]|uniref:serine hydrolase domain-containing protein n=3 Tax=Chryseobacterium arthrosphaerae TaxID=651561 RepID=UPI003D33F142